MPSLNNKDGGNRPRLRAPAFTDKEDEALLKAYSKNRNLIRGRNSMGVSQRTRNEAWEDVAKAVNDVDGRCFRTVKSVKIHYGNMLAEYKAFKSNDKNSRGSQEPQVFYKYFDELYGEKFAGDTTDEISMENIDDSNQQNQNFISAFTDLAAQFVNNNNKKNDFGTTTAGIMNSATNTSNDEFLRATYLAAMQQQEQQLPRQRIKMEFNNSNNNSGRNSVTTPFEHNLQLNGNASATNGLAYFATQQNGNNKRRNSSSSINDMAMLQNAISRPASRSNIESLSVANCAVDARADKTLSRTNASSRIMHKNMAKRRFRTLRAKLLEQQLKLLLQKEEMLRKKSRLLELKILNEERTLNICNGASQSTGACVRSSDSNETIAAFVLGNHLNSTADIQYKNGNKGVEMQNCQPESKNGVGCETGAKKQYDNDKSNPNAASSVVSPLGKIASSTPAKNGACDKNDVIFATGKNDTIKHEKNHETEGDEVIDDDEQSLCSLHISLD